MADTQDTQTKKQTMEDIVNTLTLEEVKEQMALYSRLYYKLRKEIHPDYIARKNEKERERYKKKKEAMGYKPNNYNKKYNATEYIVLKTHN